MIQYDEIPFSISEIELEADIKETLLDSFDEYALDNRSWPEEERLEIGVIILEEHLGHGVEITHPLVRRISKELGDRMEAARADYQYRLGKIKEGI